MEILANIFSLTAVLIAYYFIGTLVVLLHDVLKGKEDRFIEEKDPSILIFFLATIWPFLVAFKAIHISGWFYYLFCKSLFEAVQKVLK